MQTTVTGIPEQIPKPIKTLPMFFGPALPSQIVHELRGMHVKLDRTTTHPASTQTAFATASTLHHGDVLTAVRDLNGEDIWCYVKFESGASGNIELGELDACDCRG